MLWAYKTEQNELNPLKNVNTMFFYALLFLLCGFEGGKSGFSSLNFVSLKRRQRTKKTRHATANQPVFDQVARSSEKKKKKCHSCGSPP